MGQGAQQPVRHAGDSPVAAPGHARAVLGPELARRPPAQRGARGTQLRAAALRLVLRADPRSVLAFFVSWGGVGRWVGGVGMWAGGVGMWGVVLVCGWVVLLLLLLCAKVLFSFEAAAVVTVK